MDDVTLIRPRELGFNQHWRLYYHAGNFFYPLELYGTCTSRVKKAIKRFVILHRERIRADQARPEYKTRSQMAGEQLT